MYYARFATFMTLVAALSVSPAVGADARNDAKSQVEFGINVAQRGLWREAIYRWERATQIDPSYAAAFNNLVFAAAGGVVVFAGVYPWEALQKTVVEQGLGTARAGLFIGAMIAAGVHLAVVYGIHAHMVRTFDMTVRKLAGMSFGVHLSSMPPDE